MHFLRFFCVLLLSTMVSSSIVAASLEDSIRPITTAKAVFAIYTFDSGLKFIENSTNRLIFAAWDDGYVVWSRDHRKGSTRYHAGRIAPVVFEEVLSNFAREGLLDHSSISQPKFGPDSKTTVIYIKSKDVVLEMESWHELYEAEGKVVATAAGLVPLGDRRRFDILAKEPADYLFYRWVWNELRLVATSLTPVTSKPIEGQLFFRKGDVYWLPQPKDNPPQTD